MDPHKDIECDTQITYTYKDRLRILNDGLVEKMETFLFFTLCIHMISDLASKFIFLVAGFLQRMIWIINYT